MFNAIDNFTYSMVWFGLESNPYLSAYFGWGNQATFTMTASQVLWARTQYDGTTLTGWLLAENPGVIPSESAWAAIASTPVLSTTSSGGSGGLIGIQEPLNWYQSVMTHFTLKSWDTATSAFDITEADDSFTVDSNGYADDTLSNDSNGNLLYDGLQAYTYDAWNRLKTVAHGYRDSSGTLHSGQVSSTMSYDARGRRIVKAVNGTGPWDCTYNYYLDGDSVIEERNGSNQMIKQMVWGPDYIDDLIEVSLAISPSGQYGNGLTNLWVCQDANWNVLGLVTYSGVLYERYQYTPYGQRQVYMSGGSNDPLCYTPILASQRYTCADGSEPYGLCEFGHQGLMHDEESGLVYGRARILNPATGRWMQPEPRRAAYVDGLNLYQFEDSASTNYSDPFGLDIDTPEQGKWWYQHGNGDPQSIGGDLLSALQDAGYADLTNNIGQQAADDLQGNFDCSSGAATKTINGQGKASNDLVYGSDAFLVLGHNTDYSYTGVVDAQKSDKSAPCGCCFVDVSVEINFSVSKFYTLQNKYPYDLIKGKPYTMSGAFTTHYNRTKLVCSRISG